MNASVRLRAVGMALLAPLIAVVVAVLATTIVIAAAGSSPGDFWSAMFSNPLPRIRVNIVNQTALIYIAAVSAAIGFRMGLFNIGVEGQYTIASFAAASFAGAAYLGGSLTSSSPWSWPWSSVRHGLASPASSRPREASAR